MRARVVAAILCLTLWTAPGLTWAEDAFPQNPHIGVAQSALDAGQLDKAQAELQKALLQDNSDDALVEIYRLQGIVALYRGNRSEARRALEKLFQARPDYEPPKGTAPKIKELFSEVQADVRARRVKPVTLDFDALDKLAAGGPAAISATVHDLPSSARVRFFYRRVGSEAYGAVDLKPKGEQAGGILPADELPVADAPFAIEYYLEVDDAAGRRLAGKGDALTPLTVRVRAPDSGGLITAPPPGPDTATDETAWYQHWYVWTAVGVAAVAGGGATYYFLSRPKTGTLPLTVNFQ